MQGLLGDQVDGDRVGAEGVEDQQVVAGLRGAGQREPGVAQHHLDLRLRVAEEGEVARIPGDPLHQRSDLVVSDPLAALPVRGDRARPQPDDPDFLD